VNLTSSAQRLIQQLWRPWSITGCGQRKHSCVMRLACTELKPIYHRLLNMFLEELELLEQQTSQLIKLAILLREHVDIVARLAPVTGLAPDSAQQIIAEVGAKAATFPSAKHHWSWVVACP
jgi:transposase